MSYSLLIGFDASSTLSPQGGGIARYTLELLRALVEVAPPEVEFVVLMNSLRGKPGPRHRFLFDSPRVRVVQRRLPGPVLVQGWRRMKRPSWETLTRSKCDIVHAPASYLPPADCPVVVTVHDLGFLRDTEDKSPLGAAYFREAFPEQLPHAAHVVTPSRYVAEDVRREYGLHDSQVTPIASGLGELFFQEEETPLTEEDRRRFGLDKPYVLAISDKVIRKRPWLAAETWRALGRQDIQLAVLGLPDQWRTEDMVALPRVSDEELLRLYTSARGVLLTSREEGFGFPLLEAFSRGTPVVCARHSALAEIGGDLPCYATKESGRGFARALQTVLEGETTPEWKARAIGHARKFQWHKTASEMLGVYAKVGG